MFIARAETVMMLRITPKYHFCCRFYRLNPPRKFGYLFSLKNGCPYLQAGIGNIEFVKDLLNQSVLTNNFKRSKFGPDIHPLLGWV